MYIFNFISYFDFNMKNRNVVLFSLQIPGIFGSGYTLKHQDK
jgi:hypothetical protein